MTADWIKDAYGNWISRQHIKALVVSVSREVPQADGKNHNCLNISADLGLVPTNDWPEHRDLRPLMIFPPGTDRAVVKAALDRLVERLGGGTTV